MKRTEILKLWIGLLLSSIVTFLLCTVGIIAIPVFLAKPNIVGMARDTIQTYVTKQAIKATLARKRERNAA